MTHLILVNIVFFVPSICGAATALALLMRFLRTPAPPEEGPTAGPDDLARSA